MTTKLSIIIPILNEKKNIIKLINEIKRKLTFINYEVIFVDDNSTDGSIDILKKIKFIDKKFNYITNTGPRDLTQSCFKGIRAAKSDLIVIMDGDLQHNPSYIKFLYRKIIDDKSDLVIASRDFKKTNTKTLSLVRITFSRVLIFLLKIISGKNYVDPMSGYFIFKKKIFFKNRKLFFGKGYKILADFIYNIPMIKVSEIFINFRSRDKGNSKMNIKILIILIIFMIKKLLRI
tara:strand:- start:278 stop:976 length:699 start_codon:yes stop_codon:yes gene_type:complete